MFAFLQLTILILSKIPAMNVNFSSIGQDRRNKWFFHPLFKKPTKIILANKEILFPVVGQSPEMHAWSTTTCVFFQRLSHMFVVPRTGLNQGTPTEASHFTAWLLSTEESRLACGLKKNLSHTSLSSPV
jgi:hypothetical protein